MDSQTANLTIGALAKAAGVTVETIRFYQLKGLLLKPDKPYGGIRRYAGSYVLQLTVVDGATPEQRSWHIASANLREVVP